jgi:hypothetical protein
MFSLARWTPLEKEALNVALDLEDIANRLAKLGVEASVSRHHARLLRDLVEYVNNLRAHVDTLEASPKKLAGEPVQGYAIQALRDSASALLPGGSDLK